MYTDVLRVLKWVGICVVGSDQSPMTEQNLT